ncbi:MAG: CRISPR system precrRNA processing endoribonuclease RAMP protein Cas6 [Desulfotignum sp.]|nr:CRISPR system precrRNA processing endoribonuclease RAMP protein Cas6 [Desulfotignum sp.]
MKTGNYSFHITLEDSAFLPFYKGSTFRGVLGHALKRIICALKHTTCKDCMLRTHCAYALVFETRHARSAPEGERVSDAPHPLVIEPPLTPRQTFARGDSLQCNLLLFGEINQHLPYFVYAFEQMGKLGIGKQINGRRPGFSLAAVTLGETCVYRKGADTITVPDSLPEITLYLNRQTPPVNKLRLRLITPLRITGREKGPADLPFDVLIRSLIRRCTALLNTWGQGEPNLNYTELARKAADVTITDNHLSWFDWKRYSARQDRKMFMGGLTGEITYTGDLTPFMPLLAMGQTVHAGKNTAFGLGKYTIEA